MGRWARLQSYLFWACAVATGAVVVKIVIDDLRQGEQHHMPMLGGIAILLMSTSVLYATRSRLVASLRESQGRHRLLMDEASDPIFMTDLFGGIVGVNRRAVELTGYSREELVGKQSQDLLPPNYEIDENRINKSLRGGGAITIESALVTKGGERVPVEVSITLITDVLAQSIVRPIGERKAVEEALLRSEQVFRAVSEMTSDYAYSMKVEPDWTIVPEWLTGAYERVTGYTPEESHGRGGWQALVHPDDVPAMRELLAKAMAGGDVGHAEFRIVTKSGDIRHLRAWSRFERDEPGGRVVRIVGAMSDITDQKMLEEDLKKSRRRYAELYERLPLGIYRRTEDGVGLDANPKLISMFGYPDELTLLAVDPNELYVDPLDRERWLKLLYEHGIVMNFDVEYKRYDGTSFWGRNRARLVRDDETGKQVIEGAVVDISEEKSLDEELRATLADLRRAGDERRRLLTHLVKAKEDERNRVASDIHDDSVQVMTSVAIDLERLSRRLDDPAQQHALEQLESRVRDAVGRLRTMVFELRPPTLEEEGVGSALRLYLEEFTLDTGIAHDMSNRLDPEPDNPARIVLYRIAQEALTNVRKHSGASNVTVQLMRADGGIAMTVADDGAGFDVATALDDLSPGHIGLSEMRERAEISGGTFEVSSEKDVGTTVRVWLPELVA